MIGIFVNWCRWRPTKRRVRRKALRLIASNGDLGYFRAHELAWRAQGYENQVQARFWEAVACEIGRQVRRNMVLRAILAPSAAKRPPPVAVAARPEALGEAKPPPSAQICRLPTRPRTGDKARAARRSQRRPA
jgi:hypothetical protein